MVFSSNLFLFAFLPIALIFYFFLPANLVKKNIQNSVLLLCSLFFYSWGEFHYLWLLIISIIANHFFGLALQKFSKEKRYILFAALFVNLALLAYFKYVNFLIENLNQIFSLKIENKKIHLPIGISFFTFHAISYLVDIYRNKCRAQKNIFDLALYISFFPQLIAGPIVRYNAIEKYLGKRRHSWNYAAAGIRRFIIGLGKKVIIANPLGEIADAIFALPTSELNPAIAWIGISAYSLQIYFDFSGYCDMAIGLARVFGFKFPENFNYPYVANSIKDFWRRWHISLSTWFRDYVYIPLGGNRVSFLRQYFNLVLVFFLCGLWHGASWNFVIWGMIHGTFLVFERIKIGQKFLEILPKFLRHFYTIFVVMIAWVFFRSADFSQAVGFLKAMFSYKEFSYGSSDVARLAQSHFIALSAFLALFGISPLVRNFIKNNQKNKIFSWIIDVLIILVFVFSIIRLSAATHNPFIYFQF